MSNYCQVDVNALDHPKVRRLCVMLRDPRAWSYPVAMWLWAAKFAQSGDLGRFTVAEIEASLGWVGDEGALVGALVSCRLLDKVGDSLSIHDWIESSGSFFARREADAARKRHARATSRNHSNHVQRTSTDIQPGPVDVRGTAENREERRGEDLKREESESSEPAEPPVPEPQEPALLTFPCRGKRASWSLTASQVKAWEALYPGLQVMAELRRALAWSEANPTKRKTAAGTPRFLVSWLSRAADRPATQQPLRPARVDYSAWDKP